MQSDLQQYQRALRRHESRRAAHAAPAMPSLAVPRLANCRYTNCRYTDCLTALLRGHERERNEERGCRRPQLGQELREAREQGRVIRAAGNVGTVGVRQIG